MTREENDKLINDIIKLIQEKTDDYGEALKTLFIASACCFSSLAQQRVDPSILYTNLINLSGMCQAAIEARVRENEREG